MSHFFHLVKSGKIQKPYIMGFWILHFFHLVKKMEKNGKNGKMEKMEI